VVVVVVLVAVILREEEEQEKEEQEKEDGQEGRWEEDEEEEGDEGITMRRLWLEDRKSWRFDSMNALGLVGGEIDLWGFPPPFFGIMKTFSVGGFGMNG
jgi:hypothetical protein